MKNIKCFFGLHDWKIVKKEIGVIESSNPYASMGQMNVCAMRKCKRCNKYQVSQIQGDKPTGLWVNVVGFYDEKRIIHHGGNYLDNVIEKGTPIAKHIPSYDLDGDIV